jgi:hypothetical protein
MFELYINNEYITEIGRLNENIIANGDGSFSSRLSFRKENVEKDFSINIFLPFFSKNSINEIKIVNPEDKNDTYIYTDYTYMGNCDIIRLDSTNINNNQNNVMIGFFVKE